MNHAKINGVLKAAHVRWGTEAQIDQCIEEMAELTVELQHKKRGQGLGPGSAGR